MDKSLNRDNPIVKPGQMPSPPEFLTRNNTTEGETFPTMIEVHVPEPMPKNIDFGLYQNVVNDRKQAEMSYAEIYAQYVELVTINEKLEGKKRIFERFKNRVRKIYNHALDRDENLSVETRRNQFKISNLERANSELQTENEALKASNAAHSEAFQQILIKVGQAEAQMDQANHQFQTLAEEFDNRGILLEEADRHIQGYRAQITLLNSSIKEWQDKYAQIRDDKLLMETDVREIQMKEAGVAALNNELTNSITKAQKQIYELEDRLSRERDGSATRIAALEAELDRYQEQKRVEVLLEKSRKVQEGVSLDVKPGEVIKNPNAENYSHDSREQWNGFYQKWSHIINELTTHSSQMGKIKTSEDEVIHTTKIEPITGELLSEAGELDIL